MSIPSKSYFCSNGKELVRIDTLPAGAINDGTHIFAFKDAGVKQCVFVLFNTGEFCEVSNDHLFYTSKKRQIDIGEAISTPVLSRTMYGNKRWFRYLFTARHRDLSFLLSLASFKDIINLSDRSFWQSELLGCYLRRDKLSSSATSSGFQSIMRLRTVCDQFGYNLRCYKWDKKTNMLFFRLYARRAKIGRVVYHANTIKVNCVNELIVSDKTKKYEDEKIYLSMPC